MQKVLIILVILLVFTGVCYGESNPFKGTWIGNCTFLGHKGEVNLTVVDNGGFFGVIKLTSFWEDNSPEFIKISGDCSLNGELFFKGILANTSINSSGRLGKQFNSNYYFASFVTYTDEDITSGTFTELVSLK